MRIALAMCLLATLFNSLTTGESSGPTYYTSTSEVRLSFFGTDESGRVVNHLTTQDFAVVDEGSVIREFRSFATSTDTNVRVIVLVDLSESVLRAFRQEITGMLNLVDQTQWKDGDELSIISFRDADLSVLCARNCLRQPVGELLRTLTPGG